jgi:Ni2+-binding GTPase involved in maturation of urease and hydrogenase
MDLAAQLDVDIEKIRKDVTSLNKEIEIIECSAKTGRGLDKWAEWLRSRIKKQSVE